MANVFNSQLAPFNVGVPIPATNVWPKITGGTYDDKSVWLRSSFSNVSVNPRIMTFDTSDWAGLKSINCYEIHSTPTTSTTTIGGNAVYEISENNASSVLNRMYPFNNTIEDYITTKSTTAGYRIHSDTTLSTILSGVVLNPAFDWFVVIHADNRFKHHIAKITEIVTYENVGDGFEFEPRLKEDIPKGTKFTVYKGPAIANTHICAVGYGLLGDGTDTTELRHDSYVEVSRPTFYFYSDRATKNNALLPSRKYKVIKNIAYTKTGTYTIDYGKVFSGGRTASLIDISGATSEISSTGTSVCFLTEPDYGNYVIDKSKYTQFATIKDQLKEYDDKIQHLAALPSTPTATLFQWQVSDNSTISYANRYTVKDVDLGNWGKCFLNAQRDVYSASTCTNPNTYNSDIYRYLEYETSPEKTKVIPQLIDVGVYKSVAASGNYAEARIVDPNKIIDIKLTPYDNFKVRQEVTDADFDGRPSSVLPGSVYKDATTAQLHFRYLSKEQNLKNLISISEITATIQVGKIRVNDYLFMGIFSSPALDGNNGYKQIFYIYHYMDMRTHTTWQSISGVNLTFSGETGYTRIWNNNFKQFITNNIIDSEYNDVTLTKNGLTITEAQSDIYNTEMIIRDAEMSGYRIPLTFGDKNHGRVKPQTITIGGYQPTTRVYEGAVFRNPPHIFDYINGQYIIDQTIFDGSIEYMEDEDEGGALQYTITGRDDISKLLDTVVNKNYTFTKEYVYSTLNPDADMTELTSPIWNYADFDIGESTITIWAGSAGLSSPVSAGDVLYFKRKVKAGVDYYYLVGIVNEVNSSSAGTKTYYNNTVHSLLSSISTPTIYDITLISPTSYCTYEDGDDNHDEFYKVWIGNPSTVAGKSLSTNILDSNFPTTLLGTADKGIKYNDGDEITINTGAYANALSDKKSVDSEFSAGYPIGTVIGGSSTDPPHSFTIRDNTDTTDQTVHTISSTTEYGVLKVEELESGLTQTTVAPILPVVLGKTASNTSDTRFSNSQGIYLLNKQGLSKGGYLHLLNSELDSNGATTTFSNPGYIDLSGQTDAIDFRYENNYGPFIWRYTDLQEGLGSLVWDKEYADKVWKFAKTSHQRNLMYGFKSNISGFAVGTRIDYKGTIIPYDQQNTISTHYKQLPSPESRLGLEPIQGSRFWDISKMSEHHITIGYQSGSDTPPFAPLNRLTSRYPNISRRNGVQSYQTLGGTNYEEAYYSAKTIFESYDRTVENFHLFSTGDLYPDSFSRTNSLGKINRTLSNYGIVFKGKGTKEVSDVEHESYAGMMANMGETDSSYDILPIHSSNKNTQEIKRIGLVRLIEATYDWHFNEVDIENLPSEIKSVEQNYIRLTALADLVEAGLQSATTVPQVIGWGAMESSRYGSDGAGPSVSTGDQTVYFKMNIAPSAIGGSILADRFDNKWLYTPNTFNSGSTQNIFNDYKPEPLFVAETVDPMHNSTDPSHPTWSTTNEPYVTQNGIITGNLIGTSTLTTAPSGGSLAAGTYNINHGDISTDAHGRGKLELTLVIDGSLNLTSATPRVYTSGSTQDGLNYEVGDYVEIDVSAASGSGLLGNTDIRITLTSGNIESQHRFYWDITSAETVISAETIIGTSSTLVKDYTGVLWIASSGIDRVNSFNTHNRYGNNAQDTINNILNPNEHYFNHTLITGNRVNDLAWGGSATYEKLHSNQLVIPIHLGGAARSAHDVSFVNTFDKNTTNLSKIFQTSRVIDKLGYWNDASAGMASVNNIIDGKSYLYDGMMGIIRKGFSPTNASSTANAKVEEGMTVPNLHLSWIGTDGTMAYPIIEYSTHWDDTGSNYGSSFNNGLNAYNASKSSTSSVVYTYDTDLKNGGYFSALSYTIDNIAGNRDIASGCEIYFKPTLRMDAKNITIKELDALLSSTDIASGTASRNSNITTNGRAIIEIEDFDYADGNTTNNPYNGKDTVLGVELGYDKPFPHGNEWINFVNDLTGYYLVSEAGTNDKKNQNYSGYTMTDAHRNNIENRRPRSIHQIISHTINQTGNNMTHYLEIDNVVYSGGTAQIDDFYRVMRISQNTTYSFTPNEIELYKLTRKYTKKFNSNKCWEESPMLSRFGESYNISYINNVMNEAVLSMYLPISVDGRDDYVVSRNQNTIITAAGTNNSFTSGKSYNCLVTDGNNDYERDIYMEYIPNVTSLYSSIPIWNTFPDTTKIKFSGNMMDTHGVLSIGETFTLQTFNRPSLRNVNRCNIASTFDVVEEVDKITNDILESNSITYTSDTTSTDKYYVGPTFIGTDAYSAINNVSKFKNKRVDVTGKTITLRDNILTNDYTNVNLTEEDTDTQVSNIKRNKSTYDFFNEVIVYGDGVKGLARDRSSIKELDGRVITKEITDLTLKTDSAVYDSADRELKKYNLLNNQVTFEIPRTKIPYLKPGQIISLDYPSQHIDANDYNVLNVDYTLTGLVKVSVGEYNADLTQTIAGIISENKKQQGEIRGARYPDTVAPISESIEPTIKEMRIQVIKTTTTVVSATNSFGFTPLFGFSQAFGFGVSTFSTEVLLDENLTN